MIKLTLHSNGKKSYKAYYKKILKDERKKVNQKFEPLIKQKHKKTQRFKLYLNREKEKLKLSIDYYLF